MTIKLQTTGIHHRDAAAYVPSTRRGFDAILQQRYVAFTDPDGTAWELHLAARLPADID
jgi:hypothetical protein